MNLMYLKIFFNQKKILNFSQDEYINFLKQFPTDMLTHITRQGVRDHASTMWHFQGEGEYHEGFKRILNSKFLTSSLGIALNGKDKRSNMTHFLKIKDTSLKEEALISYENRLENNFHTEHSYADSISLHLAANVVMSDMYGSEDDNEIFIAYPAIYIATLYFWGGLGKLTDEEAEWFNDKWVYTKNGSGLPLDAGFVFIPKHTMVDKITGSKYKIKDNKPIVISTEPKALSKVFRKSIENLTEILFEKLRGIKEEDRPHFIVKSLNEFDIVNPSIVNTLKESFLNNFPIVEINEILFRYFIEKGTDTYELATDTIPSFDYWEDYFNKNPSSRPTKLIYYEEHDPTTALNAWKKINGLIKKSEDPYYGFQRHYVEPTSSQATKGKDKTLKYAKRLINNYFEEKRESNSNYQDVEAFEKAHKEWYKNADPIKEVLFEFGFFNKLKNKKVLDLGSGEGAYTKEIFDDGASFVFGIDNSKKFIDYSKHKYETAGISFIFGDINKIPLPDNTVDIVHTRFSLHYVKNIESALKEIYRVLTNDGEVFIVIPHPVDLYERFKDQIQATNMVTIEIYPGFKVTYPFHKMEEYFCEYLYDHFDLINKKELRLQNSGKMEQPDIIVINLKKKSS